MRSRPFLFAFVLSILPGGSAHADDEVPPGHPATSRSGATNAAPADRTEDDPSLPPGSISARILDGEGRPVPKVDVTLGILYNTVAKGESRKRLTTSTSEGGVATFGSLETGSGVAYRISTFSDGATFALPPFQLSATGGVRAVLHLYPVEHDAERTLVISQALVYVEVKDDRVQVEQVFNLYNFGSNAWVPTDVVLSLPGDFTAFTAQQGMTDAAVDAVPGRGLKLRGTFPPGQQTLEFRWQLPYTGEPGVSFDVGMPPHLAAARIIAPAAREMQLGVDGFPASQSTMSSQGQRVLYTEKQLRRDEAPLRSVHVTLNNLPTAGPGRAFATLLAAGAVALGVVLGVRKPRVRDWSSTREALLAELTALERARQTGEVGPKTYERARRDLIDRLAGTFVRPPRSRPPKTAPAR